jgi:hypothetical protein
VSRRQFEIVAKHNSWTPQEKSTYLITALQGRATNVLHAVPKGATYEEILEILEDRLENQHLVTTYRSQPNSRTQRAEPSLQEFAIDIKQLAHHTNSALPEDHIR